MNLLSFIFESSISLGLFFALYYLILRRLTFFSLNRIYIFFALFFSVVLPFLNFERVVEVDAISYSHALPNLKEVQVPFNSLSSDINSGYINDDNGLVKTTEATLTNGPIDGLVNHLKTILYMVYSFGFLFVLSRGLIGLIRILNMTRQPFERWENLKLFRRKSGMLNCSFFHYVFVGEDLYSRDQLAVFLKHEQVHAAKLHSIDNLLYLLFKSVWWFNPLIYRIGKEMERNHEFEVDEALGLKLGKQQYALNLVSMISPTVNSFLLNNFAQSHLKGRIKMLFLNKSNNMKKLVYVLALPMASLLLFSFTVEVNYISKPQSEKGTPVVIKSTNQSNAEQKKKLAPIKNPIIIEKSKVQEEIRVKEAPVTIIKMVPQDVLKADTVLNGYSGKTIVGEIAGFGKVGVFSVVNLRVKSQIVQLLLIYYRDHKLKAGETVAMEVLNTDINKMNVLKKVYAQTGEVIYDFDLKTYDPSRNTPPDTVIWRTRKDGTTYSQKITFSDSPYFKPKRQ